MNYGLSNNYIASTISPYCKFFKGVYSCNNIPFFKKMSTYSLIVNLAKSHEPGTHFVAIFIKKGVAFYFDPVGMPCINFDILNYFKSNSLQLKTNPIQFQAITSFFCGYYCMLFVFLTERGMPFHKFKKLFSKNCQNNDIIITELLKYIFEQFN